MKTATRCPDWCAGGHHCTARLGKGTHASVQEVWQTDLGRLVATRHQRGGASWLELTWSVRLPEVDTEARTTARRVLGAAYRLIAGALRRTSQV